MSRQKKMAHKMILEEGFSLPQRLREGLFIISLATAIFLVLSFLGYHSVDPGWSHTSMSSQSDAIIVKNFTGHVGAWCADVFLFLFGYVAYLFPVTAVYLSWLLLPQHKLNEITLWSGILRGVGFAFVVTAVCGLSVLRFQNLFVELPLGAGGVLGQFISLYLIKGLNLVGTSVVLLALLLVGMTLLFNISWLNTVEKLGQFVFWSLKKTVQGMQWGVRQSCQWILACYRRWQEKKAQKTELNRLTIESADVVIKKKSRSFLPKATSKIRPHIAKSVLPKPQKLIQPASFNSSAFQDLPPLSLLDPAEANLTQVVNNQQLEETSRDVEQRLQDFGVQAQVVAVHPGPVVTRYELQLAPGIKVSKISGLAKDLARSLLVISVRIVDVIPGKAVIGLEIPNENRKTVRLSEVLASQAYEQSLSSVSLALGVDIAGHPVVVDLTKMPHLLVAGTTGSGKSVGINAMLMSILYKASPKQVRLIMIDPKMLELAVYDGIPHLLAPVVTDMKEAANALRWCVGEMERRYRLMAALGVRNLEGFNKKVRDAEVTEKPLMDPLWPSTEEESAPALEKLPTIVVVIDEFADMMMVVGKKVEQLIARIAQKARAAGIHMILATQRPSVDVITGLIKSNIPTRMAFQVSSKIDSRTILDQQGADQLLGQGDMLYLPPGTGAPVRIHGAFVSDAEVHRVVSDWRDRGEPVYIDDILEVPATPIQGDPFSSDEDGDFQEGTESDPLYDKAVSIVTKTRRASISSVQRRLKIGYNRAARLLEQMEMSGVVTAMESNGTREVIAPPPQERA